MGMFSSSSSSLSIRVITLLGVIILTSSVLSQFGNIFEQFFQQNGGDQEDHEGHPHNQREQRPSGSSSRWKKLVDQTSCSQYLCPSTLDCVPRPVDCPCPNQEDIKCPINSPSISFSTFICTRSPGCSRVNEALILGSS
ncbi:hypothetical protein PPACK8108_LOCUS22650 [Phakopsora pachyrhizi]|uniref:Long chronological lifespan protein 2 n=1 Tax=Phakopsora pachyrhizi TaxID=170000 RepID=A0A0S1MJ72_PHAPC|nr:hypothetical protein PPACK8108_LOCUS22650 [Phakopsora pachyrhizi]